MDHIQHQFNIKNTNSTNLKNRNVWIITEPIIIKIATMTMTSTGTESKTSKLLLLLFHTYTCM